MLFHMHMTWDWLTFLSVVEVPGYAEYVTEGHCPLEFPVAERYLAGTRLLEPDGTHLSQWRLVTWQN